MTKKLFKRTIAVVLTICIALSTVTFSVSAGSFTNFCVNKLYTTSFLVAGKALTSIAGATDCEELEKMASFINVWVCGGNTNAQNFAKIEELCQEILTEVKKIEQKQDSYASYFATQQAQDKYDELVKEMNKVWDSDVNAVLTKEGINVAMLDYFEYEDMTLVSQDDKNQHIGYVAAANCYKNNTPDKYGHYYTFDEVQVLREDLFDDFCYIYGSMPSDADTIRKKADVLFNSTDVDIKFQTAIRTLSNNINKDDSYSDICAQVAYQSMPNLADQYEYVMTGMNKQFMEVIMVEMLYQEYLSMRGEYLEKCYPDDEAKWNSYKQGGIEKLEECNEELLEIMENRVSKPLQLSTNIKLSIDKYVRPEDVTDVTLQNTKYYTEPLIATDVPAVYSKKYMNFDVMAVPTLQGVELFYLYDVNAEAFKTKNLIFKSDGFMGIDQYYYTRDYENLVRCNYTDGQNTYVNGDAPEDDAPLFQTDSYAFYGNSPYNYLSQYIDYVPSGKNLYRMYYSYYVPHETTGPVTDLFYDGRDIFNVFNMKNTHTPFDPNNGDKYLELMDTKVAYESDYYRDGYDKGCYDSYFTVIFSNESKTQHKLSYSVTGSGNADMYITKSDGTKVSSGTSVPSGEDLTLWLKTVDESVYMDSVNMSKYNDYQNPNTPTSTQTLLGQDEISNLEFDEATGYYKVDFTMPYSDTKLELTTVTLPNSLDDENGNYVISSYDDLCQMSKMVNSGYETYVNGTYVLTSDIDCSGKTEFVPVGQTGLYHSANPSADGNWGFKGTFDGQGHVIKNLSITGSFDKDLSYGIFGTVSGTVENLGVENLTYTGAGKDSRVGGIAGQVLRSGTITDCYVNNSNINTQVNTQNGVAGGIAGANYSGTIENCYTYKVNITAGRLGGIVGDNHGDANNANGTDRPGTIKNCVTTSSSICKRGSATDSLSNVSINTFKSGEVTYRLNNGVTDGTQAWYQSVDNGLTPDDYPVLVYTGKNTVYKVDLKDKTYSNTLATPIKLDTKINEGTIELSNNNPMTGDRVDITINVPEDYYIEKVVAKYHADGSEETISGQILNNSCTLSHKFYDDATIEAVTKRVFDADEYGNFVIRTYDDLCKTAYIVNRGVDEFVNGSYIIANDIDCSGNTWSNPIGTSENTFKGKFDGQGYTIQNLQVDGISCLFGEAVGAEIKNLNLNLSDNSLAFIQNGDEAIDKSVGAICGLLIGGTISNCSVTGSLNVIVAETEDEECSVHYYLGGIVGYADSSTIEKCMSDINLFEQDGSSAIGGVCGKIVNTSVTDCAFVNTICSPNEDAAFGGIVGMSGEESSINNSYFYGQLEVAGNECRNDILGSGDADIGNCYSIEGSYWDTQGTAMSNEQFASGEVAYALNNGVTDGTQAWYQNIVGENADEYPVLDNTHNTVYKTKDTYTNGDLIGDMNRDGVVDQADLTLLGEYLVRKTVLTADEVTLGDVNGDGKTGPNDLAIMKAYVNQEETDYANTGKYGFNTMPTDALLVGDVNFDGVIDQNDADLISQFNVEMTDLTDEQKKAGDIDLDGHLSSKDMAEINKYIAIISSGNTYTGNIGKYSYQGFDMTITGTVTTPTEPSTGTTVPENEAKPEKETVPAPDNSGADSSTSDKPSSGKTDNTPVKTGDPVSAVILLSVLLSGLAVMCTFRRCKNK